MELPSISGLEAIIADRIEVASRSSDEILIGQARGVDVVAIGAPISTMHYAIVSTPGVNTICSHGSVQQVPTGFITVDMSNNYMRVAWINPFCTMYIHHIW